jgi:hypothetical protein
MALDIKRRARDALAWFKASYRSGVKWLGFLLTLAVLIAAFRYLPAWFLRDSGIHDPARLFELKNEVVRTMWQFVLGIGGAVALYVAWRRVKAMDRQTVIAEQGNITKRFTRAIDQLGATDREGKPKLEIRLGAIYALERTHRLRPQECAPPWVGFKTQR